MIIKEREKPLKLKVLEALVKRIHSNHHLRPKIEDEIARRRAGFKGEQSVDYYIEFLPSKQYQILHGLRLPDIQNRFFQLDTVLLSTNFIVFLEIKNIVGTLYFDQTFNQLLRTNAEKEDAFSDPILQVRQQKSQLQTLLQRNGLPNLPILPLVIISNPSTIIKASPQHHQYISKNVFHAKMIPFQVETLQKKFSNPGTDTKSIKKLAKTLLKLHTPEEVDVFKLYAISKEEIKTGVECPSCSYIPMERTWGSWLCSNCNFEDKEAHFLTLSDYHLINGSAISNEELRNFLHISSPSVARKMLTSLYQSSSGSNRYRKYK